MCVCVHSVSSTNKTLSHLAVSGLSERSCFSAWLFDSESPTDSKNLKMCCAGWVGPEMILVALVKQQALKIADSWIQVFFWVSL